MSRDIIRADLEALFKLYGDKAVKRFNMTGRHPPQLYGVKLGKEPGQIEKSFSLNKLAPMFFDGTMQKENFRHLLQQLTTPGSFLRKLAVEMDVPLADIVVQINEAWFASEPAEGRTPQQALEDSKRDGYVPPSQRPDREERLMIALHMRGYTTMGLCPIVDKPRRHAERGELEPEDITFGGRFSMTPDDEDENERPR